MTEDGVLKLGNYGFTTQAECYGIKRQCSGTRCFAPEVFEGKYSLKSDVWSLGTLLLQMMGITPFCSCTSSYIHDVIEKESPFKKSDIKSSELADFLNKCFVKDVDKRWSVDMLMNVSVLGWRVMNSIRL